MARHLVRLIREVDGPGRSGPQNGQHALQKALRAAAWERLKIGGSLRDGEIPWFWCWLDRPAALNCAREGRPFIIGPNMLFADISARRVVPEEKELCNAGSCLLQFTESDWYRDWIAANCGSRHRPPIVVWPYPIDPIPEGPLPAKHDLLIYLKTGYTDGLVNALTNAFRSPRIVRYGEYDRGQLTDAARRSRACVYLSEADRGPLALAEILLAGCPAVGTVRGAPWILPGISGYSVDDLHPFSLLPAISRALELNREAVRTAARMRFDARRTVEAVIAALGEALHRAARRAEFCAGRNVERASRWFTAIPAPSQGVAGRRSRSRGPIRAVMVTPSLAFGGAERWVVELIKHSDPDRLQWAGVAIASEENAATEFLAELVRYTRLYATRHRAAAAEEEVAQSAPLHRPAAGPAFRDTIRAAVAEADVLVTWGQPNLGRLFAGLTIPRVLCSHTTLQEPRRHPITGVTHLAAVSEAAMCYFDGRSGSEGLPRALLYNGADPARCRPSRKRSEIRAEWGVGENDVVVGYLGRQGSEKNPLAAALAVAAAPNNYYAIYYGTAPGGNGFCPHTAAWCRSHIPHRYRMYRPLADVGDVLRGFDVLMLASYREAFSLSLIEAWLAGLPVVATPVGSVPELERRFGQLTFGVPLAASPHDLLRSVNLALASPQRVTIIARAQTVAEEFFTVSAMMQRWEAYLEAVAARRV